MWLMEKLVLQFFHCYFGSISCRSGSVLFFSLPDQHTDSLVTGTDPALVPPSSSKIVRKSLISTVLWLLFDFLSFKNDVNVVNVPVFRIQCFWASRVRGSGSVPKCHGSGERFTIPASREKNPDPITKKYNPACEIKNASDKKTLKIIFLIFFFLNINLWTGTVPTYRQWTGPTCASDLLLLGDPLPAAVSHAFSPPSRPRRVLRADSLWALGHSQIQTGASSGLRASLTSGQCHILKGQFHEIGNHFWRSIWNLCNRYCVGQG